MRHTQAAEETHLDHLGLARFLGRERAQRIVERHEIGAALHRHAERLFERHGTLPAPAFLHPARPRVIDQDASHQPRRHREEVTAVLPLHAAEIDEAKVGLVHKGRRLHRVPRALAAHVSAGELAQFRMHDRHE